ncbi:hypothetical protein, partial [Chamaesiphon sp.]|uniref:hypothetical protein n=1 Tax=Chamaesiphon sp. TaxID=2814140 RepID=UPI0035948567
CSIWREPPGRKPLSCLAQSGGNLQGASRCLVLLNLEGTSRAQAAVNYQLSTFIQTDNQNRAQ